MYYGKLMDIDEAECEQVAKYDVIKTYLAKITSNVVGMFILQRVYQMFSTIELTVKWIDGRENVPAPLPWIVFLPFALIVWIVCFATYHISRLTPGGPVEPMHIAHRLRNFLRNVRYVKIQAKRQIAWKRQSSGSSDSWFSRFYNFVTVPPTLVPKNDLEPKVIDEFPKEENGEVEEEEGEEAENLNNLLNKSYPENDEDDPTFCANGLEETDSDESSVGYESLSDVVNDIEQDASHRRRKRRRRSNNPINSSQTSKIEGSQTDSEIHTANTNSSPNTTVERLPGHTDGELA